MNISKIPEFISLFNEFKKSENYASRKKQSSITTIARKIISETLKNTPLTNQHLTGLIQMLNAETSHQSFVKYLNQNITNPDVRENLWKEFLQLGQTGYTGAGKAAIRSLSVNQLIEVKNFLLKAFTIRSIEEAKNLTDHFDSLNIPELKQGIYSPWLHYINPTIFPVINGSHIDLMFWFDVDRKYSSCIEAYGELMKVTKEPDLSNLDFFAYHMKLSRGFKESNEALAERLLRENADSETIKAAFTAAYKQKKNITDEKFIEERAEAYMNLARRRAFQNHSTGKEMNQMHGSSTKYWLYAPGENAKMWEEFYQAGVMGLGSEKLGDLNNYNTKQDIENKLQEIAGNSDSKRNDATANYEFKSVIKPGDIVLVKKGRRVLLGYGEVTSDYYFDDSKPHYQKFRKVRWIKNGHWKTDHELALKTLTDITNYPIEDSKYEFYFEKLLGLINGDAKSAANKIKLTFPLNTIFYGPPGTGKTYNTVLRAAQIIDDRTEIDHSQAQEIFNRNLGNRIEFITFHQNYSYEDFIQGLRPDIESKGNLIFERKDGVFSRLAINALFEYYKIYSLRKRAQKSDHKDIDINEVYLSFFNFLRKSPGKNYTTKTGSNLTISSFSDRKCIRFSHSNSPVIHTVSGQRLIKLYEKFPNLDLIKNVHKDITETIGGCNATVYWTALKEFIVFYNSVKNARQKLPTEETAIDYEDISFEEKKEFLSTVDYTELKNIKASDVPNYVLIIDEINRANISRVFGELITLIECDKRSHGSIPMKCTLPSGEEFIVPSNLYIIGTMNTADKSIALLDIALRRRFEFEPMYPIYEIYGHTIHDVEILKKINEKIRTLKGCDFQIGHAYFMDNGISLAERMNKRVIPLLLEYFMNDETEVKGILSYAGLTVEPTSWPLRINGKQ